MTQTSSTTSDDVHDVEFGTTWMHEDHQASGRPREHMESKQGSTNPECCR